MKNKCLFTICYFWLLFGCIKNNITLNYSTAILQKWTLVNTLTKVTTIVENVYSGTLVIQ